MTIDYERIIDLDNGTTIGFFSYGHVDKNEFARVILYEEDKIINVSDIVYAYARNIRLGDDDCDTYATSKCDIRLNKFWRSKPITVYGDVF